MGEDKEAYSHNQISNNKNPTVSVVIPTKNGGELFREVLKKIREQDYSNEVEIVVVDSGSSDKTVEYASEFDAKVKLIEPKDFNHGLTRNYGIQESSGQIIVLMTQDALPANNKLIHYLVSAFDDNAVVGAYARQIAWPQADVLTKRNLENWLTGRPDFEVRQLTNEISYENLSPFEKYLFCNFDNVCSAMRKSTWQKIPFDKSDFGEDIEWCLRVLKAGYKIAYQPQAIVIHSHHDRPISYEYKRTYMCHRKLYELYELQCVPSFKAVVRSVILATVADWRYVLQHEKSLLQKLKLMLRVPVQNMLCVWGQYCGAKDENLKRGKKLSGV